MALSKIPSIQHVALEDGSAKGEETLPCPECSRPILAGHLITPLTGHRFMWRHVDCDRPFGKPPKADARITLDDLDEL